MRKAIILLALLFLVVSCSSKAVDKKVDNPANLYVQSVELMKKKKYDEAIKNFSAIRENFPFDPMAVVAQVKQGDAHFEKKEYLMAAGIYEDFFNSYPDDENSPYVLKRIGECYEKLSPSIDRDQAHTFKAMERFTYLKNRYPSSTYASDVDARLKKLELKVAAREFYIGEFYYKAGKYIASIMRLENFLGRYPDAKDRDKALFYIGECYKQLNRPEKSQSYSDRLKQEYPKSVLVRSIARERKTFHVAQAEPRAAGLAGGAQPAPRVVPATFSFDEKKKKEIVLKPVETAPSKKADVEPRKAQDGTSPGSIAPAPTGKEGSVGTGRAEPAGAGASPSADQVAESPEAKKADGKDEKRAGSKKDSLGFFSEKKPVDVVADSMEGLEKGKIIVFKGNVIAKQEDLYLFSDLLTAYINEETNEIERAKAEGNVKIVKLDRTATCKEAFFYNDKGEIILKGDVVVFSGKDKLSGDTVTYYINEDRVYVEGEKDKRAKATVHPK